MKFIQNLVFFKSFFLVYLAKIRMEKLVVADIKIKTKTKKIRILIFIKTKK